VTVRAPAVARTASPGLHLDLGEAEWTVLQAALPPGLLPDLAWALDREAGRTGGRSGKDGEPSCGAPSSRTSDAGLVPAVVSLLERGVLTASRETAPLPHSGLLALLASAHGAPRAVHARAGVGSLRREAVLALLTNGHVVELRADSQARFVIAAGPLTTAPDRLDALLAGTLPEPEEVPVPPDRARGSTPTWAAQPPQHVGLLESRVVLSPDGDGAMDDEARDEAGCAGARAAGTASSLVLGPLAAGTAAHLSVRWVGPAGGVTHHAEWCQGHDRRWRAVTLSLPGTLGARATTRPLVAADLAAHGLLTFSATDRALMHAELLCALMDDQGAGHAA